ncbi:hypothetical protein E4T56_gene7454, partial [Termitomyces sp. T112]
MASRVGAHMVGFSTLFPMKAPSSHVASPSLAMRIFSGILVVLEFSFLVLRRLSLGFTLSVEDFLEVHVVTTCPLNPRTSSINPPTPKKTPDAPPNFRPCPTPILANSDASLANSDASLANSDASPANSDASPANSDSPLANFDAIPAATDTYPGSPKPREPSPLFPIFATHHQLNTLVPPTYSGVSQQPWGNPRSPMIPSTYQRGPILDCNQHPPT